MSIAPQTRLTFFLAALLVLCEPALANKFETIGSGVSGSTIMKREFLQVAFLVGGVLTLIGSVLAVVVPHTNASFLNYANWKASAIVLALMSIGLFTAYTMV